MLLQASKFTQRMSKDTKSMMKRLLKVVEHVLPVWGGGVHSKEQVAAYIADDRLPPWVIPTETASAKQLHAGLLLHDAKHDLARYAAGKDTALLLAMHQHAHVLTHTPTALKEMNAQAWALWTCRCIEEAELLKVERARLLHWATWAQQSASDALASNPGPGYAFWLQKSLMVSRAMKSEMNSVEFVG